MNGAFYGIKKSCVITVNNSQLIVHCSTTCCIMRCLSPCSFKIHFCCNVLNNPLFSSRLSLLVYLSSLFVLIHTPPHCPLLPPSSLTFVLVMTFSVSLTHSSYCPIIYILRLLEMAFYISFSVAPFFSIFSLTIISLHPPSPSCCTFSLSFTHPPSSPPSLLSLFSQTLSVSHSQTISTASTRT